MTPAPRSRPRIRTGQVELPPEEPLLSVTAAATSPEDSPALLGLGPSDDSPDAPASGDSDAAAEPDGESVEPAEAPDEGFLVGFATESEGDGLEVGAGVLAPGEGVGEELGLETTPPGAGFHSFGEVNVMVLEK